MFWTDIAIIALVLVFACVFFYYIPLESIFLFIGLLILAFGLCFLGIKVRLFFNKFLSLLSKLTSKYFVSTKQLLSKAYANGTNYPFKKSWRFLTLLNLFTACRSIETRG